MELTENQIKNGYWYYRPNENFPPKAKLLSEYIGEERLSLIVTPGYETDSQLKKRERSYPIEIPEKLRKVKVLWADDINQDTFDAICTIEGLKSLYVQSSRIKDISAISNLKNIEHLALLNLTKVDRISVLSELPGIQTLKLEHFKRISDFRLLSTLTTLQGLQIDGSMYTAQRVDNFNFIRSLTKLKYLTLINTRATDKDLSALLALRHLEMLQSSANYPKREFEKLRELRNLKWIGGNIEKLIKKES